MLKNKILDFDCNKEKKSYIQSIAEKNLSTGYLMDIFIIFFEIIMIFFALYRGDLHLTRRVMYLCSYIFLLTCSVIVFIIVNIKKTKSCINPKNIMTLSTLYTIAIVFWGVFVSVLDSKNAYQPIVYLTVLTGVTFTLMLDPIISLIIQLSASIFFVLGVSISYDNGFDFNQTINITIYTSTIVILGIVSHNRSLREFRKQQEINIKNEQLLSLNNQLSKANLNLFEISATDPLTKLYNRMKLNSDINYLMNKAKEKNDLLCCAVLDIDHFKKINDTYGHIVGDECLIAVAGILRNSSKKLGIYRYGGEEFIILSGNLTEKSFLENLEKIRHNIELLTFSVPEIKITISLGVYLNKVTSGSTSDEFLNNADKALYKAKDNGRNCVCVFTQGE